MKRRSPRIVYIPLIIGLILMCHTQLLAQDTSDKSEIVISARRVLSDFLSKADRDYLNGGDYIFPEDDLVLFDVGIPYPNYTIDPSKLAGISTLLDYQEALTFLSWGLSVLYDAKPRSRMVLGKHEGEWVLSAFGGDPTPMEYVRRNWPIAEGYSHSYVLAAKQIAFISIQNEDDILFYPYNEDNAAYPGLEMQVNGQYSVLSFDDFVGMIPVFIEINKNAFRIVD